MGKCKVIPFRKPVPDPGKSFFSRILEKLHLSGKKNSRCQVVSVRGFGPGALPVHGRDRQI